MTLGWGGLGRGAGCGWEQALKGPHFRQVTDMVADGSCRLISTCNIKTHANMSVPIYTVTGAEHEGVSGIFVSKSFAD